jgi:hypothetical protein
MSVCQSLQYAQVAGMNQTYMLLFCGWCIFISGLTCWNLWSIALWLSSLYMFV